MNFEEFIMLMGLDFLEDKKIIQDLTKDGMNPTLAGDLEDLNKKSLALVNAINNNPLSFVDGSMENEVTEFKEALNSISMYGDGTVSLDAPYGVSQEVAQEYAKRIKDACDNGFYNLNNAVKEAVANDPEVKKYNRNERKRQKLEKAKEEQRAKEIAEQEKKNREREEKEKKEAEERAKREAEEKRLAEEKARKEEAERLAKEKARKEAEDKKNPIYISEQEKFEKYNNKDHNNFDDITGNVEKKHPRVTPKIQTVSTENAFTSFIDKLESAKTRYNSDEYKNIIKYLRSINTDAKPYDENYAGYAAKLIKTKEYINKYLDHKASTSVKQNAYKKLAAVEALNKEIEKRIEDLYDFVAPITDRKFSNTLLTEKLNTTDELSKAPELTVDELSNKSLAAQKKGIDVKDIVDMKFTDDCMRRIIYKASEGYETNVGAMEAMRLQFQNNPSKVVVGVPNAEAANVNQPQPQNAPVV